MNERFEFVSWKRSILQVVGVMVFSYFAALAITALATSLESDYRHRQRGEVYLCGDRTIETDNGRFTYKDCIWTTPIPQEIKK